MSHIQIQQPNLTQYLIHNQQKILKQEYQLTNSVDQNLNKFTPVKIVDLILFNHVLQCKWINIKIIVWTKSRLNLNKIERLYRNIVKFIRI
jgi:hypothetical protein